MLPVLENIQIISFSIGQIGTMQPEIFR